MNFLAIVAALGLEQWRAFRWRVGLERTFVRWTRRLERSLNGGTLRHGAIATVAAVAPPVVIAALVWWMLEALPNTSCETRSSTSEKWR